jgi:single-strand DNA-binding protein
MAGAADLRHNALLGARGAPLLTRFSKEIPMASVNKVILVGNCGRDPEVRYLPSGQAVANVSVATSSRRKDKNSGEMIEDTQWHRVTFYDRLAEIAGEYVKKGRPIYVEGRLKYGTYVDKTTGVEKNTVDIIATEMQLLGGREGMGGGEEGGGGGGGGGGYSRPAAAPRAPAPAQRPPPAPAPARPASGFDDMDDDIPF